MTTFFQTKREYSLTLSLEMLLPTSDRYPSDQLSFVEICNCYTINLLIIYIYICHDQITHGVTLT
jgi:hypothetical protein